MDNVPIKFSGINLEIGVIHSGWRTNSVLSDILQMSTSGDIVLPFISYIRLGM